MVWINEIMSTYPIFLCIFHFNFTNKNLQLKPASFI